MSNENKFMQSEVVNSVVSRPIEEVLEVELSIEPFGLDDVAYTLVQQIEHSYTVTLPEEMQDAIKRYLYTTLILTIWHANKDGKSLGKYTTRRHYNVPPVWMYVLSLVGNVYDGDSNIILRLKAPEVDQSLILSPEEMTRLSFKLGTYQRASHFVPFSPQDEGSPEFMSMLTLGTEIVSRKPEHPVYALASSILRKQAYSIAYANMCRVTYGPTETLFIRARDWVHEFIGE